jgi:hypothetical protein
VESEEAALDASESDRGQWRGWGRGPAGGVYDWHACEVSGGKSCPFASSAHRAGEVESYEVACDVIAGSLDPVRDFSLHRSIFTTVPDEVGASVFGGTSCVKSSSDGSSRPSKWATARWRRPAKQATLARSW